MVVAPGSDGDFERASDPWVDISADGTVHAMAQAFNGSAGQPGVTSAMLASRSTDGGRTWSPTLLLQPDGAGFFNDENALTAGPIDTRFVCAFRDRLDTTAGAGLALLALSTDGATAGAAREAGSCARTAHHTAVWVSGKRRNNVGSLPRQAWVG